VNGPDDAWIKANMTAEPERTVEQAQRLAISDRRIDDLHRATHVVIATPMFNFTVPWSLKAYIDLIVRVGKTFSFDPTKGPGPLFHPDKKLLIVRSSAFDYAPGTSNESFDHLTPYLKFVFGFMGITKVESIDAGNQWGAPDVAQASTGEARLKLSALSTSW
jgi:FMN-dependent NADH-azoreductase